MYEFIETLHKELSITLNDITALEEEYKISIPTPLKDFYLKYNAAEISLCTFTQKELPNNTFEVHTIYSMKYAPFDQVFTELTRLQHERGETALNTQYRVSTEGMPKELLTKPKVSLESKSIPPALNNCSEPKAMAAAHGSGEAITGMDTVWRTDLRDGEKHAPYHHKYRYRKIELPWVYEQMGPCRTCKTNKGAYFNYATS